MIKSLASINLRSLKVMLPSNKELHTCKYITDIISRLYTFTSKNSSARIIDLN